MINLSNNSYLAGAMYNPYKVTVKIGKYTSIAKGLRIMTARHPMNFVSNFPFYERKGWKYPKCTYPNPIRIGSDVWIGADVTIVDAVTIGDGAIVGACSVVAKDIPPYAVVVGNPIKIIRYRFNKEEIAKLLIIKWWDLPEDILRKRIESLIIV